VQPAEFAAALRVTIGAMQRGATNASVQVVPDYPFSFNCIRSLITFAAGSLQPLSVQLGEVKAISEVLFKAKINSLDGIRRERVSTDDACSSESDYIEEHSITNETAVLTPYEVTFRCFSTELAGVMTGFATSTHCFIIKTVTIAPAEATSTTTPGAAPSSAPPAFTPPMQSPGMRGYPAPGMRGAPPGYPLGPATRGGPMQRGGGDYYFAPATENVLDEQPLRVTMALELVKPIAPAK
jgi:hypothetical protein